MHAKLYFLTFGFKEIAEIAKLNEKEYQEYEASLNAYRDIKNSVDWAHEKGKIKGKTEEKHEMVIKLHKKGFPVEEIAEITELPIGEITKIIEKQNGNIA